MDALLLFIWECYVQYEGNVSYLKVTNLLILQCIMLFTVVKNMEWKIKP